tara:strand:- start:4 stop:300 length:297 start_codon:yes stop_codon:yes gene_type:complete
MTNQKITYTDTTELSNMRLETESHIRTLERALAALNKKIVDPVWQQGDVARRDRVAQLIEGNRAYVAELDSQIELAAVNNINAAHRHSQLPVNFWPAT